MKSYQYDNGAHKKVKAMGVAFVNWIKKQQNPIVVCTMLNVFMLLLGKSQLIPNIFIMLNAR